MATHDGSPSAKKAKYDSDTEAFIPSRLALVHDKQCCVMVKGIKTDGRRRTFLIRCTDFLINLIREWPAVIVLQWSRGIAGRNTLWHGLSSDDYDPFIEYCNHRITRNDFAVLEVDGTPSVEQEASFKYRVTFVLNDWPFFD
jgi:hypothetical protein